MPRIKVSKLIVLIVLSQVLCLAVLSSAIWELPSFYTGAIIGLERTAEGPPPDSQQQPRGDREYVFETPHFLGKTGLFSECMSNELRSRIRQELMGVEVS